MEIPLIITLLVLVLLVFPIWAIVRILALGRDRDDISRRLDVLTEQYRALHAKIAQLERDPGPSAESAPVPMQPIPAPAPIPPRVSTAAPAAQPPPIPSLAASTAVAPVFRREPVPPTLAPPPVQPAAPPPEPPPTWIDRIDWEQFMGAKLFAWLGGLAALLAVAFFVKYSFEHDLIPPEVRVAIGFLFAAALVVGGLKLGRERYAVIAQTLIATGISSLYAVAFACNSVYHFAFFGAFATFVLMSLITVAAFLLAVRLEARVIAILGLLGGFLTPVLLSTGHDNPPGLFGYIALLDIGLLAVALHRRWDFLVPLGATGTIIMQVGWASRYLEAGKAPTAMVVCLGFCAIFFGAYLAARRLAHRITSELLYSTIAFPFVSLGFAFAFFFYDALAMRPGLLFSFVLAADACLLAIAWIDEEMPKLHLAAGAAVFALLAVWTSTRLTEPLLPWALACYLGYAALHTAFPLLLERHRPAAAPTWWSQIFPPLALLLMFGPLVKLSSVSLLFWPCVLLVDVIAIALAVVTASLSAIAVVLVLTLIATGLWIFQVPATVSTEPAVLLVLGGFAVLFFGAGIFVARTLGDRLEAAGTSARELFGGPRAQIPAFAALLPFLLLIMMTQRLPLANPSSVFGLALLLTVLTLGLAAILMGPFDHIEAWGSEGSRPAISAARNAGVEWLPACALIGVTALEYAWYARHQSATNAPLQLSWYGLFVAVFAAYPFLFRRRFAASTGPWAVAALAAAVQFPLVYWVVDRTWPNEVMGLLPAVFAVPPLVSLIAILRGPTVSEQPHLNQLAWFGGIALLFITLIFPIQYERQWITLGWALEGVALLWLFHRVPHPGLRATGAVLLVAAFARLALNPAVLAYRPRSAAAILNWYLYSYGLVAACLFVGAGLTRPEAGHEPTRRRTTILGVNAPALFHTLGTILVFLLVNVEIADFFSPPGGHTLTFQFSGNFARDMSYTIAWALFALGLLLIGMWKGLRAARYAAIALLSVALVKLFFHDLARLPALYRIGALLAVAIIASLASVAYQRFLPADSKNVEPAQ
jgi:uncharacterized membrane protein